MVKSKFFKSALTQIFGKTLHAQLGFSVIVNAASIGVNLLSQILIIRFFGVDLFGAFAYWRNNIQMGAQASLYGFHTASLRFLPTLMAPEQRAEMGRFLKIGYSVVAVLGVAVTCVLLYFIPMRVEARALQLLILMAAGCLSFPMLVLLSYQLRLLGSIHHAIFVERLGWQLLFLGGVIVLILLGLKTQAVNVVIVFTIAVVLAAVILAVLVRRAMVSHDKTFNNRTDETDTPPDWKGALSGFFFFGLGNVINLRVGLLVIGAVLCAKATGQFAFMVALAGIATFPLYSFNQIVGPRLSILHTQNNPTAFAALVRKTQLLSLAMGCVLVTIIFICQPIFLWITARPDAIVATVFAVLLLSSLINAGFGPVGTALAMLGEQKRAAIYTNLTAAIKIPLYIGLALKFGLIGAAFAELIATTVWNFAMFMRLRFVVDQQKSKLL